MEVHVFLDTLTADLGTFAASVPFVFVGIYLWFRFLLGGF
ncbi:MAG: hypothetical protein AMXMBFR47_30980 [Planctomycetota bacterium]